MDRTHAPLFEKMVSHYRKKHVSFHVPGHKSGKPLMTEEAEFFSGIMSIDYTEITGLDDLHHPDGVILEAQRLAAECFGAEKTFFLVNGSTVGNLAMILTVCRRNDILIVQRNVHKSVIHGLMLAGARAVFLSPRWDEETGLAAGVRPEDVDRALAAYPEAKGVLLTNPNYYGMGIDISAVARIAHHYGKPLLVDEAHGAHFGFHPDVPPSALSCGADAVVQSTHKMLTAMTMGAMLHVQGERIDRNALSRNLSILQSSSPSYPIMASLDLARRTMHMHGRERLSEGLAAVHAFHQRMKPLSCFRIVRKAPETSAYETLDPFKVTVCDATGTLSGFALQRELERFGCMVEMADARHVLLVFSLASEMDDAERLASAFLRISRQFHLQKKENRRFAANRYSIPQYTAISPPVSFDLHSFSETASEEKIRTVRLEEAVHARSAEMIVPYPPGIPVVYQGEVITAETARYLQSLAEAGAKFQGAKDPRLNTVAVYDHFQ